MLDSSNNFYFYRFLFLLSAVRFFSGIFLHTFAVVGEVERITVAAAARYMAKGQLL